MASICYTFMKKLLYLLYCDLLALFTLILLLEKIIVWYIFFTFSTAVWHKINVTYFSIFQSMTSWTINIKRKLCDMGRLYFSSYYNLLKRENKPTRAHHAMTMSIGVSKFCYQCKNRWGTFYFRTMDKRAVEIQFLY